MNKIFNKWKLLIGGLSHIMDKADEKNTQASRKLISKAEKQIEFLKDKNALVTMHFNSDVQERFKVDSKNIDAFFFETKCRLLFYINAACVMQFCY